MLTAGTGKQKLLPVPFLFKNLLKRIYEKTNYSFPKII